MEISKTFLIFSQKKAFVIFWEMETQKKLVIFQEMETLQNFLNLMK